MKIFAQTRGEIVQVFFMLLFCIQIKNPASKAPKEVILHTSLVSRWKEWIISGVSKEVKQDLLQKYSRRGNCGLEAPKSNPKGFL